LFPLFAASVVYTGGNLPRGLLTPLANLLPVIVDTGGKFATCINNTSGTGGKISTGVIDTGGAP
jgi:hypothetical protein